MTRTNGAPIGATARDYFDGCDNVPMFDLDEHCDAVAEFYGTPAAAKPRGDRGQLVLPSELLPTPTGQLFA